MIFLQFLCIFLTAAAEQNITVSSVIGIAGRSDYGYSAKNADVNSLFNLFLRKQKFFHIPRQIGGKFHFFLCDRMNKP